MKRAFELIPAAILLCLSLAAVSVQAETFETVLNNGNPENRVDIAIVGDGYTAAEMEKYRTDVQNVVLGHFGQEPFLDYKRYFNVHRIDVVSAQSGSDHPERSSLVNTAFDSGYNCSGIQRLICVNVSKVNNVLANSVSLVQRDIVLVIVNDSEYGGSGGSVAVASTNAAAVDLVLHEEGHSFGLLADEYGGPAPPACNSGFEPFAANVTKETARAQIKWRLWIDANTPLPTTGFSQGVPGAYQGAQYCDAGLYRPTFSSKMRTLGAPFEQINSEQLVKRMYNFVSPLDSRSPDSNSLTLPQGQNQSFAVSTPAPVSHGLTVTWFVDGVQQALGPAFNFVSNNFSAGAHTVIAAVHDPTTFVRNDPNELLSTSTSWSVQVVTASSIQLDAASFGQSETGPQVNVTLTRSGDTAAAVSVDYATSDTAGANDCNVTNGVASSRCDYLTTLGRVQFAAGETSQSIAIPVINDSYAEGSESFTLTLSGPLGATLATPSTATITITDNDATDGANPIDTSAFFVRQSYLDFLNREPDAAGLNFWIGEIDNCTPKPQCTEVKRINVSAAFFLAIEFQETGFLVYRIYRSSYGPLGGNPVPLNYGEFLADTQQTSKGVIVNSGDWQAKLESNKVAFLQDFVTRSRFVNAYPTTSTPAEFVDALFVNAGITPSGPDRVAALNEFNGAVNTSDTAARARSLRRIAENPILAQVEKNKAFVLMQYFGYMRRNPYDAPEPTLDFTGYNFWLGKLNQFGGNFIQAEMVKAFITSVEYRQRFGP
ncbi:MAG TPA: M64 family metallopeptidase [Pyrinomonadaceae bacterium]|nr:M64 family metallopeptidase [Pyrinomonadaceae bacterium]